MINLNNITIDAALLKLIAELDEFKGRCELLGRLAPDVLQSLRRVATVESVGSSTRIEGARLTDHEVGILLANLNIDSFRSRDEEEVAGYAEAMSTVFDSWEHIPLTKNHVKQLHGILLKFSSKDVSHRGECKKFPNSVEVFDADGKSIGVIFETAAPFDTPRLCCSCRPAIATFPTAPWSGLSRRARMATTGRCGSRRRRSGSLRRTSMPGCGFFCGV